MLQINPLLIWHLASDDTSDLGVNFHDLSIETCVLLTNAALTSLARHLPTRVVRQARESILHAWTMCVLAWYSETSSQGSIPDCGKYGCFTRWRRSNEKLE